MFENWIFFIFIWNQYFYKGKTTHTVFFEIKGNKGKLLIMSMIAVIFTYKYNAMQQ